MIKTHIISGHNFHGQYKINLRGPVGGFVLSAAQLKKYGNALCPYDECKCGGGYGDGSDRDSARIEQKDWDEFSLVPAAP